MQPFVLGERERQVIRIITLYDVRSYPFLWDVSMRTAYSIRGPTHRQYELQVVSGVQTVYIHQCHNTNERFARVGNILRPRHSTWKPLVKTV